MHKDSDAPGPHWYRRDSRVPVQCTPYAAHAGCVYKPWSAQEVFSWYCNIALAMLFWRRRGGSMGNRTLAALLLAFVCAFAVAEDLGKGVNVKVLTALDRQEPYDAHLFHAGY